MFRSLKIRLFEGKCETSTGDFLRFFNSFRASVIEIQTSNAGPVRSDTKEKLTQIGLAEAFHVFHIHNLDLQARLRYASADSRVVHIAEKVMRYRNKHAGAGHTVPIDSVLLTFLVLPGELMTMNKSEMKELVAKKEKQEAND